MTYRSLPLHLMMMMMAFGCSSEADSSRMEAVGPGLTGVLMTESEEALANTTVMACMATTCLFGETDASGRFLFSVPPPAEIAFKTHPDLDRMPRHAAALHPIRLVDESLINLETVHVPLLPGGAVLGPPQQDPQALDAGDGLRLTLVRADLTPSLGDILHDVAARRVPTTRVSSLPDLGGEQVDAVYALHPFAAKSRSRIAVRAPSELPPGTRVSFRTISEIDGLLSIPAPGEADGGAVQTDPGSGITALTWLIISH